jgi:biotin operon repressor
VPDLRPELLRVVVALCSARPTGEAVSLDELGDALGTLSVSTDEIGLVMDALEARGLRVEAPAGGGLELHLRSVVLAAGALRATLTRRPTVREVAEHAGITERDVRHALALLRIMQR